MSHDFPPELLNSETGRALCPDGVLPDDPWGFSKTQWRLWKSCALIFVRLSEGRAPALVAGVRKLTVKQVAEMGRFYREACLFLEPKYQPAYFLGRLQKREEELAKLLEEQSLLLARVKEQVDKGDKDAVRLVQSCASLAESLRRVLGDIARWHGLGKGTVGEMGESRREMRAGARGLGGRVLPPSVLRKLPGAATG